MLKFSFTLLSRFREDNSVLTNFFNYLQTRTGYKIFVAEIEAPYFDIMIASQPEIRKKQRETAQSILKTRQIAELTRLLARHRVEVDSLNAQHEAEQAHETVITNLRESLITIVDQRYPHLTPLAKKQTLYVQDQALLSKVIRELSASNDVSVFTQELLDLAEWVEVIENPIQKLFYYNAQAYQEGHNSQDNVAPI
jgi:ribonuclease D